MLENYIPIVITASVAIGLAVLLNVLARVVGPYRPNLTKLEPYESGMDPVGEARDRYSISFYMVAMEFLVFDLEVVFIYPWAVRYLDHGPGTLMVMIFFIFVLFVGLIYTLKKGTLDWDIKRKILEN
ncbi:NADH-quinone oxidoreductase subunit A [Halalkalibaculum sp. DA3122]|uniref:NADH-quinone oxidoreductase subunit A n=1 Tax=Halalkalibaculum sp. DA3122 TaxID=3373607 RepID=UPI003754A0B8